MRSVIVTGFCFAATAAFAADKPDAGADAKIDFVRDIQPLLAKHCYDCHGAETQESGLRVDQKSRALAGGDTGAAILPGKSAQSLMIARVTSDDPDTVMPPGGDRLTNKEVALLRAWIDQGADWPPSADVATNPDDMHWSFRPIRRPNPAQLTGIPAGLNPIDAFVRARLVPAGIEPSSEADRYTLIRRLSLDLLGLPPTPDEVSAFVNDSAPDAYERLVDRLLRSPHFGERWGRHWLDKARYADSDGYEKDRPRPNAWRWRDWVIAAINDDMPLDQFTIEQLAGDLLPDADATQKLATAFHRQTLTNTEGGTDQEQFRVEAVFDRVETTGTVWLGLTIGCARCHSHKYDPITQREYYQLFAFFNNGDEINTNVLISDAARREYEQARQVHDQKVRELQNRIAAARQRLGPKLAAWEAARSAQPTQWDVAPSQQVRSTGGATLVQQADGSWLAGGKTPNTDTYIIEFNWPHSDLTGLRLETLPDDSLPAKGPGRVKHGNFVLNEIRVEVAAADSKKFQMRKLARATADWEQGGPQNPAWPARGAIDGDAKTGWAIASEFGRPHQLVVETAADQAITSGPFNVRVSLVQEHGQQHTIGRFRLSATASPRPLLHDVLPDEIARNLALSADDRTAAQQSQLLDWYAGIDPEMTQLQVDLEALQKQPPKSPYMSVAVIGQRNNNPRETRVLRRGDFLQPASPVEPAALSVLPPIPRRNAGAAADRLDLARWLVAPENPLTPRVIVNQIWQNLFGVGLVRTVNDFGTRGEEPTHPLLLDWLADELQRLNWSRKQMIKTIVMSGTYRQSSAHRPELADIDPNNRLLYRQNRFRVEAEIIRDVSLAASGLLSAKIGGPSVFPPMPTDVAALSYANNFKWNESKGEDRYRRGMYTFFKRTAPHPNLTAFDCPDSNTTSVRRDRSNTPLQALTTLNNQVYVEASRALARRLLTHECANDADRISFAYQLCVARPPTPHELEQFAELLATCRDWYAAHSDEARQLVASFKVSGHPSSEIAAWMAVSRMMLNMDEFITRE